uniref:Epithelial mitogen n=1 Tax=Equus asinus TaxID=9793 RepID=A0A9L0ISP8_EQUAS
MAFGVPISVCLFFNAHYSTEGPIALKFSPPCLEDLNSYCINGVCAFHHELEKAICRCLKLKSPYNICSGGRPL